MSFQLSDSTVCYSEEKYMTEKIKKSATIEKNKKVPDLQKLVADPILPKERTDAWVKALLKKGGDQGSKKDALKVIDYLKEEMAHRKTYQSNASTCSLNSRAALYFLDIGGYQMLGHSSLKACLEADFPSAKTLSTLYREANAAKLEVLLLGESKIGTVKESVLRPLSKLKSDTKIKKAWKNAMAAKSEKSDFPTAEEVKHAVAELLEGKNEPEELRWSKSCASDISQKIAPKLVKEMNKYGNITKKRIGTVLDLIEDLLLEKPQEE
jgi:hypothetical protein